MSNYNCKYKYGILYERVIIRFIQPIGIHHAPVIVQLCFGLCKNTLLISQITEFGSTCKGDTMD